MMILEPWHYILEIYELNRLKTNENCESLVFKFIGPISSDVIVSSSSSYYKTLDS